MEGAQEIGLRRAKPLGFDQPAGRVRSPGAIPRRSDQAGPGLAADAKLGIGITFRKSPRTNSELEIAPFVSTREASFVPESGAVAYLKQAGVRAEITGWTGHHGSGHLMMGSVTETLKPILTWLDKNVNRRAPFAQVLPRGRDSTA